MEKSCIIINNLMHHVHNAPFSLCSMYTTYIHGVLQEQTIVRQEKVKLGCHIVPSGVRTQDKSPANPRSILNGDLQYMHNPIQHAAFPSC